MSNLVGCAEMGTKSKETGGRCGASAERVSRLETDAPMNLDCRILNPLDHDGWNDEFVVGDEGTFFHSREWAEVLAETYGYRPTYFAFYDGRTLIDFLPLMDVKSLLTGRRGVSLPFTDYCGLSRESGRFLRGALDPLLDHARKSGWKYVELRCGDLADAHPSTFFYRHTLDLTGGEEAVWARFKSNTRRNIKKGQRQEVEVASLDTRAAIDTYYNLHCLTRKRHGLPPQPHVFFRKIYEHIISKGKGFVVLAHHGGKPVAGAVYFRFGRKALYKFGASDMSCQAIRPNNLVMWAAIRRLVGEGCEELCFGRTEQENEGLRQFKRAWGTEESILNYYKYDLAAESFVTESAPVKKIHHKIFGMIPVPVLKILGSLLYKHMG